MFNYNFLILKKNYVVSYKLKIVGLLLVKLYLVTCIDGPQHVHCNVLGSASVEQPKKQQPTCQVSCFIFTLVLLRVLNTMTLK